MGKLEVICGPMFSGKSEELLRRLKRAQIAKQSFILYKPAIDNRYSETHVVTHSGIEMKCHVIHSTKALLDSADNTDIIAIDEAQFLDENTPNIVEKAEDVLKVTAVCEKCGKDATHTYRHSASHSDNNTILVGASDHYEARCRNHWQNHT